MRMYDIIVDKRDGKKLSQNQMDFVVNGIVGETIPDYQTAAFLMAVYWRGLDAEETLWLTQSMAQSGDTMDLSSIPGTKVDKHSTGGVGDKTTLICGPIVAACGVPVAKMSGRGLGHTGGTLDKLEAIPGLRIALEQEEFLNMVNRIGIAVIGQTGDIAPADKKIYALRDVTGTVESFPLIASSIMSKKLASGADAILLDVKTGSGALMKSLEDSIELARQMVAIGAQAGRRTAALITQMDIPLGNAVGNALEVVESVQTLQGHGPADLTQVCIELAANMLYLADAGTIEHCRFQAQGAISTGAAYQKLKEMVMAQGGDTCFLDNLTLFGESPVVHGVIANKDGYIQHMDTQQIGNVSVMLGAGRAAKEDAIDYQAGIRLLRKTGDFVREGEVIAYLYTSKETLVAEGAQRFREACTVSSQTPNPVQLILGRMGEDGVYTEYGELE